MLISLTINFDYIIVSIEESKNLTKIKVEELEVSLEANENELRKGKSGGTDTASKIHQEV